MVPGVAEAADMRMCEPSEETAGIRRYSFGSLPDCGIGSPLASFETIVTEFVSVSLS